MWYIAGKNSWAGDDGPSGRATQARGAREKTPGGNPAPGGTGQTADKNAGQADAAGKISGLHDHIRENIEWMCSWYAVKFLSKYW